MANSYNVSSLPAYVEQHRLPLIGAAILGGKTAKMVTLQSGIKSSAAINLINTEVVFGNGAACGWNEAGATSLTQRNIVTGQCKINMAICDKTLLGKWAEYQVRIGAGQKSLPFEEDFTKSLAEGISAALDKVIWNGDTSSANANLSRFDGLLKNVNGSAVATSISAGVTPLAAVQSVVKDIPAAVAAKNDVVIFCAPEFFTAYRLALVNANLFHYDADASADEQTIPGTSIKLVAVGGLVGIKKLFAASLSNVFFGCDMMDDSEKFEIWYSQDNREFRVAVEFNAGANVAYPSEVVVGTYTTLA